MASPAPWQTMRDVARRGAVAAMLLLALTAGFAKAPAKPGAAASAASAASGASSAARSPGSGGATSASMPATTARKSFRVQVTFSESQNATPRPVAGATVRLSGSNENYETNASGITEVFGAAKGTASLKVLVVNAAICTLKFKLEDAPPGALKIVVPKKGTGTCRFSD